MQRDHEPAQLTLLQRTDVLIDGVYRQDKNDDIGLRGSDNQRIHFLSGAYTEQSALFTLATRRMEFHISGDAEVLMVGIPPRKLAESFNSFLKPIL